MRQTACARRFLAAMIGGGTRGREPHVRHEAARVHHAARRRGGAWPLAARAQQPERMRRIGVLMNRPRTIRKHRPASRRSCRACSNWAGPTAATCGSTIRWGAGDADAFADTRRNWSRSRRTSSWPPAARPWRPLQQATRTVPIVFVTGRRSGRRRLRREPGAAGRQRHRVYPVRIRHQREMAGAAQRDRARRDASGGPSRSRHARRDRPVRRNPGRGAVVRGGVEPDRRARRRRDRARRHGIRARPRMAA